MTNKEISYKSKSHPTKSEWHPEKLAKTDLMKICSKYTFLQIYMIPRNQLTLIYWRYVPNTTHKASTHYQAL